MTDMEQLLAHIEKKRDSVAIIVDMAPTLRTKSEALQVWDTLEAVIRDIEVFVNARKKA